MNRKKKGKYIGLAGALLVHVVVIALLILVGFTLPEQSEEGGVPVMMEETMQIAVTQLLICLLFL